MRFTVINKKRSLTTTTFPSQVSIEPPISSQYSTICHGLLDQTITHSVALQEIIQLIKKASISSNNSKYLNLMKAMYGLALDLCKEINNELYLKMAMEATKLDNENYNFRVHLRDSHSEGDPRLRIWSAEWVTMHSKAIPSDYALYQVLLSSIGIEMEKEKITRPFDKVVNLLLESISLKPFPFSRSQYEEYELELQVANWSELINRTIDTIEKAQSNVFTRNIRVNTYEQPQPQSQTTNTQRALDSQRASKRIKTISGIVETKKKMDREALMRVLGVDDQFITNIEEIKPIKTVEENKEIEFQVPESFVNVIALFIWELERLLNNDYQIPEQILNKFRNICLMLDKSVYPNNEFYIKVLLYFAERLEENDQELEILQSTPGIKRDQRMLNILAKKAELEGNLDAAQELLTEGTQIDGNDAELQIFRVKRAIIDKVEIEITRDISSELAFDYHISRKDYEAAFNVFVADPFAFKCDRLSQLKSLTIQQAQFLVVWCWKHFNEIQSRGCLLNALHQVPLNEERTVLEWVEQPDEGLVRHLIDTSTEAELVYTCWASLYGLPPLLNITETLFINCDAQPVMTMEDWKEIAKLCLRIYKDEGAKIDIHPVTWDRLLTYATSLHFPTKNLILNRERLKAYLHFPLFSPLPKYIKLNEEEALFVKIQLLQATQVIHSTDSIKRKVLVGKNADAGLRQLRRSLKLCVTDVRCFDLLGTIYKEHAGRLLLGTYTDILKHRPLIQRLLNKSLRLFLYSKESSKFELMSEVSRWMRETGLASINASLFSKLRDKDKSVSVTNLQFTIAKASVTHQTQSPLTLITLGRLCPDNSIKLKFFEKAWTLAEESKQYRYISAYELIQIAYELNRKEIIEIYFPEACQKEKDVDDEEGIDIISVDTTNPFFEAMHLIETFDIHSTQHAHIFFLATHPDNQSPLTIIDTFWSRLFPMLKKPKTPAWHSVYLNEQDPPSHYMSCLSLYLSQFISFLSQYKQHIGTEKTKELLMIIIDKLRQVVDEFPRWKEIGIQALELYDELTGGKEEFKVYKKGMTGARRSAAELQKLLNK